MRIGADHGGRRGDEHQSFGGLDGARDELGEGATVRGGGGCEQVEAGVVPGAGGGAADVEEDETATSNELSTLGGPTTPSDRPRRGEPGGPWCGRRNRGAHIRRR